MNLHAIASSYVAAVNPMYPVTVQSSLSYTTATSGHRASTYAAAVSLFAQVQPLDAGDLRQLDSLNIQGVQHKLWVNGDWEGLVRQAAKGGDLIKFGTDAIIPVLFQGRTFLVVHVFERFANWVSLGIVEQVDP